MTRIGFNRSSYDAWRATVPFTDDQIADAIEAEANDVVSVNAFKARQYRFYADRCRAGFVSSRSLGMALGRLVKSCAICGRKALYRVGSNGRCSLHRDIKSGYKIAAQERRELRSADRAATDNAVSAVRKKHQSLKQAKKKGFK